MPQQVAKFAAASVVLAATAFVAIRWSRRPTKSSPLSTNVPAAAEPKTKGDQNDTVAFAEAAPPSLEDRLLHQLAYYFSDENLARDVALRNLMDEEGWVLLEEVAQLRKIKAITKDHQQLIDVISRSGAVELSPDASHARKAGITRKPDAAPPKPKAPKPPSSPDPESGPCKYFAAGFCAGFSDFGGFCSLSHNPTDGQTFEQQWLRKASKTPPAIPATEQPFPVYFILDLEGKDEIIELPVLALRSRDLQVIGRFHRWIRPVHVFKNCKRGTPNLASNAVPFAAALPDLLQFVAEMEQAAGGAGAFVTCGNWDLKTQIPKQCSISKVELPMKLRSWINLKGVYDQWAQPKHKMSGMKELLSKLHLPLEGMHHLGMDDVDNIARCAAKMMQQGAVLNITGCHGGDKS